MKQPNIVFILIDDMGWRDISCYGSTFYETPNIDRLFKEGMHFTDAYASCPVCSPTRASIMSGKYPAHIGLTNYIDRGGMHPSRGKLIDAPYIDHLPDTEQSLAHSLRENGYRTWHVGKWHCGGSPYLPEDHGFDVNIGGCHWGAPGPGGYISPWKIDALKDVDVPEGTFLDDWLTDRAVSLIQKKENRPFFLNMWYYLVHTPVMAKEDLIRKYEDKRLSMGLDKQVEEEEGERFPCEHKRDKRIVRRRVQSHPVYAAMIEILDTNIGKLIDAVEAAGERENTIFIFTSDNGGLSTAEGSPTCNAPLIEGKGWMYEGGVREPLIISWPGVVPPGSVSNTPVTSPDFYPTLLQAAGLPLKPDQHTDGVSLLDHVKGGEPPERDALFWHYPHYGNQGGTPGSSVRMGDYKLIEFFEDGRLELYNLRKDISEEHERSDEEPEKTEELHSRLIAWRENVNAVIPEPNPEWNELE